MADDTPDLKRIVKVARDFSRPYRIDDGRRFRLKDYPAGDTRAPRRRGQAPRARRRWRSGVEALAELQDMLYAQDQWAVLLIFQAMDAAGKDGAIKHVMSGVNPQGCQVYLVQGADVSEELDHDYLWRCMKNLPERGRIGIFNRSYYEEMLVVRVHPEFLARQKLPPTARRASASGRSASRTSARSSATCRATACSSASSSCTCRTQEQKKRFLERIDNPEKNWKFSAADAEGARALGRRTWRPTRT